MKNFLSKNAWIKSRKLLMNIFVKTLIVVSLLSIVDIALAVPNAAITNIVVKKFNPSSSKIGFSVDTQIGQSSGKVQNIDGTIECQSMDCRENTKVNLKIPFSGLNFAKANTDSDVQNPFMSGDLSMIIQPLLMPFRQKTISLVGQIKKDPTSKFHPLFNFVGSATLDGKAEKINLPVKVQKTVEEVIILANYNDEGDVELPMGKLPINGSISSEMRLVFR